MVCISMVAHQMSKRFPAAATKNESNFLAMSAFLLPEGL